MIPFLCEREKIIADMNASLGCVGQERLLQAIQALYHWQHMKKDIFAYV